jgi:hypothetical protein
MHISEKQSGPGRGGRKIMKRQIETTLKALLAASLAATLLGCAARPPQRIQDAIQTANRYLPKYVAEANKALADPEHLDRESLAGIGNRLAEVLEALNRWASGQEKNAGGGQTMTEILDRNSEAVREAGRHLVEISGELAAGKIDDALARLYAARQAYSKWEELDQAVADIEGVIRDREGMLAIQRILAESVGTVLGSVLKSRLP